MYSFTLFVTLFIVAATAQQQETDCLLGLEQCLSATSMSNVNGVVQCCTNGDSMETATGAVVNGVIVDYCKCKRYAGSSSFGLAGSMFNGEQMTPEMAARFNAAMQTVGRGMRQDMENMFSRMNTMFQRPQGNPGQFGGPIAQALLGGNGLGSRLGSLLETASDPAQREALLRERMSKLQSTFGPNGKFDIVKMISSPREMMKAVSQVGGSFNTEILNGVISQLAKIGPVNDIAGKMFTEMFKRRGNSTGPLGLGLMKKVKSFMQNPERIRGMLSKLGPILSNPETLNSALSRFPMLGNSAPLKAILGNLGPILSNPDQLNELMSQLAPVLGNPKQMQGLIAQLISLRSNPEQLNTLLPQLSSMFKADGTFDMQQFVNFIGSMASSGQAGPPLAATLANLMGQKLSERLAGQNQGNGPLGGGLLPGLSDRFDAQRVEGTGPLGGDLLPRMGDRRARRREGRPSGPLRDRRQDVLGGDNEGFQRSQQAFKNVMEGMFNSALNNNNNNNNGMFNSANSNNNDFATNWLPEIPAVRGNPSTGSFGFGNNNNAANSRPILSGFPATQNVNIVRSTDNRNAAQDATAMS